MNAENMPLYGKLRSTAAAPARTEVTASDRKTETRELNLAKLAKAARNRSKLFGTSGATAHPNSTPFNASATPAMADAAARRSAALARGNKTLTRRAAAVAESVGLGSAAAKAQKKPNTPESLLAAAHNARVADTAATAKAKGEQNRTQLMQGNPKTNSETMAKMDEKITLLMETAKQQSNVLAALLDTSTATQRGVEAGLNKAAKLVHGQKELSKNVATVGQDVLTVGQDVATVGKDVRGIAELTSKMNLVLQSVDSGVKKIGLVTDQILGITTRTEALMKTFRRGGIRGIIQGILFDEWLIFYMYMILHPYAPTTTEMFSSVWVGVLAARRFMKLRGDMKKGEIITFSFAGIVNNYLTSPWKAIYLMYWYNQKFQSMHGTQEFDELFPGGPEKIFTSFTQEIMNTDINNLSKLAQNTPIAIETARAWIEDFFSKYPDALDVLGEVCPTWASDKTAFFNCLGQFAVGNLSVVVKGVATNLAVPGVLWEGGQYMNSEKQVLYWTMSMVWQGVTLAFGELFSSVGTYMKGTIDGYMTGAVCKYVPSMLRMGYTCEVPPVQQAAEAFASAAAATATAMPSVMPTPVPQRGWLWGGASRRHLRTRSRSRSAMPRAIRKSVTRSIRNIMRWGGGNGDNSGVVLSLKTQNALDSTLSRVSLYLIMAYSIDPITDGKISVDPRIIRSLEDIMYNLIRIESNESLMGYNTMLITNSGNSQNLTFNKLMNANRN